MEQQRDDEPAVAAFGARQQDVRRLLRRARGSPEDDAMCLGKDSRLRLAPLGDAAGGPESTRGSPEAPARRLRPVGAAYFDLFASAGVKPMIWTPAPRATSIAWITS